MHASDLYRSGYDLLFEYILFSLFFHQHKNIRIVTEVAFSVNPFLRLMQTKERGNSWIFEQEKHAYILHVLFPYMYIQCNVDKFCLQKKKKKNYIVLH